MDNDKKQKKNYSGVVIIILLLSFSWGVPSLIHGHGFINGISENIRALLVFIIIGIAIMVAVKIFKE